MTRDLLKLAELWEDHGVRIAASALGNEGVRRADTATAAHCFTIARELRALANKEQQR